MAEKVTRGPMGPHGSPWAPWAPWVPMGPTGPLGPMGPLGPLGSRAPGALLPEENWALKIMITGAPGAQRPGFYRKMSKSRFEPITLTDF